MIFHLIRKELRAQRLSFVVLSLLAALILLSLAAKDARHQDAMSTLGLIPMLLLLVVTLGTLVLSHGAFTVELRTKTVLFMEGLPVSRATATLAKFVVVGGGIFAIVLPPVLCVLLIAARSEPIALTDGVHILLRVIGFSSAMIGVTTLGAIIGRYRIPMYLLLVLVMVVYEQAGGKVGSWGLFGMIEGLATQRGSMPWRAFITSIVLAMTTLGVGLTVLLARDGSVAVLLGERMSHGEKLVTAATILLSAFVAELVIKDIPKEPFQLTGERALESQGARVKVSMTSPGAEGARLLERVRLTIDRGAEWLDIPTLEPTFVVHRGDLDADRFDLASLPAREGVMVRANLVSLTEPDDLIAFVFAELVSEHSRSRTEYEPRMWVHDGGPVYWTERFAATSSTADPAEVRAARRELLLLRALYAQDRGWTFADLSRWHTVRDQLARPLASALAWSVLDALERARDPDTVRRFAQDILAARPPRDARALFPTHHSSAISRLEVLTEVSSEELERTWLESLAEARVRLGERLTPLPVLDGELSVSAPTSIARTLDYRVRVSNPRTKSWGSVLYGQIDPLEGEVVRELLDREAFDAASERTGAIPRSFGARAQVYVAFAIYVPELACEVISGARRMELE